MVEGIDYLSMHQMRALQMKGAMFNCAKYAYVPVGWSLLNFGKSTIKYNLVEIKGDLIKEKPSNSFIPVLTLPEILEQMPHFIDTKDFIRYNICIQHPFTRWVVSLVVVDNKSVFGRPDLSKMLMFFDSKDLIEACFNMWCWILDNKPNFTINLYD